MRKLGYVLFIVVFIWLVKVNIKSNERETTKYLKTLGYTDIQLEPYLFGEVCERKYYDEDNLAKYHFRATKDGKIAIGNISYLPLFFGSEFTVCEK